jgi:hypothetical protein
VAPLPPPRKRGGAFDPFCAPCCPVGVGTKGVPVPPFGRVRLASGGSNKGHGEEEARGGGRLLDRRSSGSLQIWPLAGFSLEGHFPTPRTGEPRYGALAEAGRAKIFQSFTEINIPRGGGGVKPPFSTNQVASVSERHVPFRGLRFGGEDGGITECNEVRT